MAELLARLLAWLAVTLVATTVRLLLLAVRLALWLFALAGFRGARLAGLAATVAGVRWAVPVVGVGPAVRLAAIGWAAWAVGHHRAAIRQSAAVRRATLALEGYAAELGAAARRLQPPRPTKPVPRPASTLPPGGSPDLPPPLAFAPSRLGAVAHYLAGRWGAPPAARTNPASHAALVDRKER
jgi:hypothetical protein